MSFEYLFGLDELSAALVELSAALDELSAALDELSAAPVTFSSPVLDTFSFAPQTWTTLAEWTLSWPQASAQHTKASSSRAQSYVHQASWRFGRGSFNDLQFYFRSLPLSDLLQQISPA